MTIEQLRHEIAELVRAMPDDVLLGLVRERMFPTHQEPAFTPAPPPMPAPAPACPVDAPAEVEPPDAHDPDAAAAAPGDSAEERPPAMARAAELLADRRSDAAERLRLDELLHHPDETDGPEAETIPPAGETPASIDEPVFTREQRRSRRKREIRSRTISIKRLTKRDLDLGRALYPVSDHGRPATRSACLSGGERPCPYVSCSHHLYLDVSPRTGAIKVNFPDLEVDEMTESCSLDVADRGGATLEDVGGIMNLTRERVRQVEVKALAKVEACNGPASLRDFAGEGRLGRRRLPVIEVDEEDPEDEEDDLDE